MGVQHVDAWVYVTYKSSYHSRKIIGDLETDTDESDPSLSSPERYVQIEYGIVLWSA